MTNRTLPSICQTAFSYPVAVISDSAYGGYLQYQQAQRKPRPLWRALVRGLRRYRHHAPPMHRRDDFESELLGCRRKRGNTKDNRQELILTNMHQAEC